ncbi:MAG: hypothetical protein COV72_04845 [Candidatus Omnitrophica bacterium CG11_big_fil_rev_8_21_14_0_20_42_13]|uniref:Rrf2 family transcriptional regulator n=1 Tax=Candidatus Ghiorseimicrobium undicola TaxID=1974746 RepID=A0A2H0LZN4_9BACT|nr:MAG: hypothetical protein COV72_04845 [Candidatus Omnitrophica bacterium CG11_big_fil_rev_8_21_14_0_20_42_13]
MSLINRDTDYAIKALCFMAKQNKEKLKVSDLTRALKIPYPFLRKILQALHKHGFLAASKGKGGGFILARSPRRIFLNDLILVFQGPLKLNNCFLNKKICPDVNSCLLRRKISDIEKRLKSELSLLTLDSLMINQERR